jgi:2-polyprenyl-6-methoxyphenol hydroxylase-like FAD-dependent oxidoreductase
MPTTTTASHRQRDIAICGCGPAGLAAALLLHRAGHRVRVFERFDSPRAVGSGLILQPTGLAVLAELGLIAGITSLGTRIDRLFGRVAPSNRVVLDVRYSSLGPGWHGIAIHRSALFGLLHDAVTSRGIEITSGVTVDHVDRSGALAVPISQAGRRLGSFDLVVDALGAGSPLGAQGARRTALPYGALWVNVPWAAGTFLPHALEQRYRRASRMAGILPIGRLASGEPPLAAFFWSLKSNDWASWQSAGLDAWKGEVAALWPAVAPLLTAVTDADQLTFARYDHFTLQSSYSERLVHIGDAARATSPQLGQGANMALLDALALARALDSHADLPRALEAFAAMRSRHTRLFQWASATFTPFYQSDSRLLPLIRDWFAAPLSRLPIADKLLARLVSGTLAAPLSRTDFKSWRP